MSKAHKVGFFLCFTGIVSSSMMFGAGLFFAAVVITETVSQAVSKTIHMQPAILNMYAITALSALVIGGVCGAAFIATLQGLRREIEKEVSDSK